MREPGHWFKYFLAHQLRLTVAGVESMPLAEFYGWRAYFADMIKAQKNRPRRL
jgi:hypothetical protein